MRAKNVERVQRATTMLRSTYLNHPTRLVLEDVTDALTDLRHLCDRRGYAFGALDQTAYSHYIEELAGRDDTP